MTEKNIVRLIGLNRELGFKMLLKEYKEQIYWHIRRITVNNEDAQDATQETFIRVFRLLDSYDRKRSFTAWIYRIATNEAYRIIEKRHPSVEVENNPEAMSALADDYVNWHDVEVVDLQKAVLSLPRKQQLTFNLRYYDELDFNDIAEITEITPTGAKANWHNAKVKIYSYLKDNYA